MTENHSVICLMRTMLCVDCGCCCGLIKKSNMTRSVKDIMAKIFPCSCVCFAIHCGAPSVLSSWAQAIWSSLSPSSTMSSLLGDCWEFQLNATMDTPNLGNLDFNQEQATKYYCLEGG